MRLKFDKELNTLNNDIIYLGSLCENAIEKSAKILVKENDRLVNTVHDLSEKINQKEREIENSCLKLLLKQQPVAKDLRTISAALKIVSDMERIGRQSEEIVNIVTISDFKTEIDSASISDMTKDVIKMVNNSVMAFVKKDIVLAEEVIKYDDVIDKHFVFIRDSLINRLRDYDIDGEYALDILMIIKYLERIGDHAENIARWVRFSILGKMEG